MRTFSITTLGCKVNQYESDQITALLASRGLRRVETGGDLRVINTCSVTTAAAGKSRQTIRREIKSESFRSLSLPVLALDAGRNSDPATENLLAGSGELSASGRRPRVIVTGCWATSDPEAASKIPGVDAVIGHHEDVAAGFHRFLDSLQLAPRSISLPQAREKQAGHQRAFLKIQDGCDAHCTYCIIPQLRPKLTSKPVDDAVTEARRLVDAGHVELVLTGIFLGAYGQPTALRRRQHISTGKTLGQLIESLCTRVPGLKRVRLSSLEPGDLSEELLTILAAHPQVVPHFHLPLQSGSDLLLRRMNRQYTRGDFLRMIDSVRARFDRPAITTDIIVGFPGETDAEFSRTVDVVDEVKFIHVHAFSYSPRPRTAAARWTRDFVRGPAVNERIVFLDRRAAEHSLDFRRKFVGETVELLAEKQSVEERGLPELAGFQHGRCERYFPVHFQSDRSRIGELLNVRIEQVTSKRTIAALI